MHYHVMESTPGCLPESDPACCDSLQAARDVALSLKRVLQDSGYTVPGNIRTEGAYWARQGGSDRVVEIVPVLSGDCLAGKAS